MHLPATATQIVLDTVLAACTDRGATAVVLDTSGNVAGERLVAQLAAARVPEVGGVVAARTPSSCIRLTMTI